MTFDPTKHLIKVKNNDYLEAKWRLVWLHDKYPTQASITTELVRATDTDVLVRAEVTIHHPDGVTATFSGYKSAPIKGQFPAVEKAETGAIARALAHAGFGTQFAGEDVDEGLDEGQLADSPVQRPSPDIRPHEPAAPAQIGSAFEPTEKQIAKIGALVHEAGFDASEARRIMAERYGKQSRKELTRKEASDFIDWLTGQVPAPMEPQPSLV